MDEEQTWYLVDVMQYWDEMKLSSTVPIPIGKLTFADRFGVGFCPIFETLEEAQAQYPAATFTPICLKARKRDQCPTIP